MQLARLDVAPENVSGLTQGNLNWGDLWRLAKSHGVRPLVARSLAQAGLLSGGVPIQGELYRFSLSLARRNSILAGELLRLMRVMEAAGVRAIAMKGPALAAAVYGDLFLREFKDLDILVARGEMPRAEQVLSGRGYRYAGVLGLRDPFLTAGGQYSFEHGESGVRVDLHWDLAPRWLPFPLRTGEVLEEAAEVFVGDGVVPTFSDRHLALFLVGHGCKERWRQLKWVCDLAEFKRARPQLDWGALAEQARSRHCLGQFEWALRLVEDSFGVEKRSGGGNSGLPLTWTDPEANLKSGVEEFVSENRIPFDRLRDRARVVLALVFHRSSADYEWLPLPRGLWWIYFFSRPVRLGMQVVGVGARRIAGLRRR